MAIIIPNATTGLRLWRIGYGVMRHLDVGEEHQYVNIGPAEPIIAWMIDDAGGSKPVPITAHGRVPEEPGHGWDNFFDRRYWLAALISDGELFYLPDRPIPLRFKDGAEVAASEVAALEVATVALWPLTGRFERFDIDSFGGCEWRTPKAPIDWERHYDAVAKQTAAREL